MWRRDKKKEERKKRERERIQEQQAAQLAKEKQEEQDKNAKQAKKRTFSVKPPLPLNEYLGIRYRLVKTEHFDNYMKALGVGMLLRKVGYKVVPTLFQLDHDGEQYILRTSSLLLNIELNFNLNIPAHVTAPNGQQCQVTYSFQPPNILIEVQSGIRPIVGTREFSIEKIHMTLTIEKTSCKLTYINEAKSSAHRKTLHLSSPTATIMSESIN